MFVTEAKLYTIDRNLQIATGTSPSNSLHVLQALHAAETRLELISLFYVQNCSIQTSIITTSTQSKIIIHFHHTEGSSHLKTCQTVSRSPQHSGCADHVDCADHADRADRADRAD